MTDEDPTRFAAGPDGLLKGLIQEGKKELGSPAQLAAVAAKLGPVLGGGGGSGGGPGAPRPARVAAPNAAGMGLATKLGIAALGAATLATVLRVATTQETSTIPLTSTPEGPLPGQSADPNGPPDPSEPFAMIAPEPSVLLPPRPHHAEAGATPAPAKSGGPIGGNELRLLTQAQDAVAADPAKALELCNEHSKRYAGSRFAQEREVLAITALVALGRTDEARKRSEAFQAAYPGSPLTQRIEQILP